jgi:hypothetical protein
VKNFAPVPTRKVHQIVTEVKLKLIDACKTIEYTSKSKYDNSDDER